MEINEIKTTKNKSRWNQVGSLKNIIDKPCQNNIENKRKDSKSEMRKKLQLIPQNIEGDKKTMNNYMPTNWTTQKKQMNFQKHTFFKD